MEFGLYGNCIESIKNRLLKIFDHSKAIIFTIHRWELNTNDFDIALKYLITLLLKNRSNKPFYILVHLEREAKLISKFFCNIKNIVNYPVFYLTQQNRIKYSKKNDIKEWKKKIGLNSSDIVLGLFGTFNHYKDYITVFKALTLLPEEYKVCIFGGQHIACIKQWEVDAFVTKLTDFIDNYDLENKMPSGKRLTDRILFQGNVEDENFYQAIANVDFVIVSHMEVGQSASTILSIALEMEKKIIVSVALNFLEYLKILPNCFAMFNIGNHHELKNKILNFDEDMIVNLKKEIKKYPFEKLADIYLKCYKNMNSSTYENLLGNYVNLIEAKTVAIGLKMKLRRNTIAVIRRLRSRCLRVLRLLIGKIKA